MPFASYCRRSNLEFRIAGLERKAKEATIIRTTANALRLTGNDAEVIIIKIDVVTVSNPTCSNLGPHSKRSRVSVLPLSISCRCILLAIQSENGD